MRCLAIAVCLWSASGCGDEAPLESPLAAGALASLATPANSTLVDSPSTRGLASWYGTRFQGRPTASGEPFDAAGLTAAHRTLPFGTRIEVSRGKRSVVVCVNDRGPQSRRRVIDISRAAAKRLDMLEAGVRRVALRVLRLGKGERCTPDVAEAEE